MFDGTQPRFRSPEAALRFYFRAGELLCDNLKPGILSRRNGHHARQPRRVNVICDFLTLDSCFRDMDEAQAWLLKELYGPTCFGTPQRRAAELYLAARRRFPERHWTPRLVRCFKRRALELVEEHLKRRHLI
jgi:hypothetical protein